jgi:hypothetical protein
MKPSTFLKISFILFVLLYSCGKDDDAPVCCGTEIATDANFDFYRKISGTDSIYWIPISSLDTFYNPSSNTSKLYFRAKSPQMDSYQWIVGTDPATFTDSLFFLEFGGINGNIDVTLTTTKDVNQECFPNDTGTSTQTKSIIMKTFSLNTDLPIYGKYEGYNEDTPDTIFQIEIGFYPGSNIEVVYNFPYQCNLFSNIQILTTGGRGFIYDEKVNYPCGDPTGKGWLEPGNQTLIIEYTIDDINDSSKRISKRFVGQRI